MNYTIELCSGKRDFMDLHKASHEANDHVIMYPWNLFCLATE